ncbi:YuzL family protein [Ectobacillus ponti]|uniref:YuzL family protein n=1 Tax=Ectobacillus ponti TaxID=2961894 RepID=A0AA41XAA7_9BACI|nr:YuzL family protein [Ectobacillus ponti]MCP8969173.1 YuzL family protein [Ectobacillus ponti]
MPKKKKDSSKSALNSPHVEGQGTTTTESGREASSARHKQKQP